jgi:hypothetical protein
VHIHPNNETTIYKFNGIEIPPLAEFTFYRNDRIKSQTYENNFLNLLDFKNVENNSNIELPSV